MSSSMNAYRAYSAATRTIAKTRQVVMLYDGAIRFIKQAQIFIGEKRIEERFRFLVRASDIMVGLQNSIDFENGGEVAHTLHRFYSDMTVRILAVNMHPRDGISLCDAILTDLTRMRDVWDDIDRGVIATEMTDDLPPPVPGNAAGPGNVTVSA